MNTSTDNMGNSVQSVNILIAILFYPDQENGNWM